MSYLNSCIELCGLFSHCGKIEYEVKLYKLDYPNRFFLDYHSLTFLLGLKIIIYIITYMNG